MAIIGQVRRMIRKENERKLKKYEFEHRTRVQKIKLKGILPKDAKGRTIYFKEITHFPVKKEEKEETVA